MARLSAMSCASSCPPVIFAADEVLGFFLSMRLVHGLEPKNTGMPMIRRLDVLHTGLGDGGKRIATFNVEAVVVG